MSEGSYLKLGLFVLLGCVLFVAGLLAFGLRGRLSSSTVGCVTLFNRSVQGLSTDAAVKFRGFTVGRVTAISLAAAADSNGQPLVQVNFEIDPATLAAQIRNAQEAPDFLRKEIERGLKVYLTLQGVTGICFLDLNYGQESASPESESQADAAAAARGRLVYIPNGPSQIFEIGESLNRLMRTLNDIDFVDLSRDVKRAIRIVERAVIDLDAGQLSKSLTVTLEEVRGLAVALNGLSGHLDGLLNREADGGLARELETSARQLRQTLKRLDQLLGSARGGLPETLDNLRAMSENMREMSELLKGQPSQILFGRPPAGIKPESGGVPHRDQVRDGS